MVVSIHLFYVMVLLIIKNFQFLVLSLTLWMKVNISLMGLMKEVLS
nr:MAG TPA: hypothetical protein [Caudoviricetes sp.]